MSYKLVLQSFETKPEYRNITDLYQQNIMQIFPFPIIYVVQTENLYVKSYTYKYDWMSYPQKVNQIITKLKNIYIYINIFILYKLKLSKIKWFTPCYPL